MRDEKACTFFELRLLFSEEIEKEKQRKDFDRMIEIKII